MNFRLKLVALFLAVMMVMTSCQFSIDEILDYISGFGTTTTTTQSTTTQKPNVDDQPKFNVEESSTSKKEMLERYTLTEEEVDAALALLDEMIEVSKTAESVDEIDVLYTEFEDMFYHIAQQMTIASIIYYCNMSDQEAIDRHLNTTDMFYDVQDKYMQACRTMYLESPYSAELFADWSEEEINELLQYDPETVAIKKEVEELQTQYNDLPDEEFYDGSVEIYTQIVTKNNELARLHGYDNYYDYASENVYSRDYSPEDLATFRQYVIDYIVPNFNKLNSDWSVFRDFSTSKQTQFIDFLTAPFDSMKRNYLIDYLNSLEGTMGEGMRNMFEERNCIFSYNSNSHPTAFQTYLYEDETPFCLFGKEGQSSSTIVHEIGHYYASYANNDLSNYDLCETHSQGNEFLFLNYSQKYLNKDVYTAARAYNLFNAYYVIVVATIVDEFEQRVYSLESVEGYTSEDFDAIMDEVLVAYGHDADWFANNLTDVYEYWRNVAIDNPVYYISYAVSAIAAIEIFSISEDDYDAAITAYTTLVEGVTAEDGFLNALKKAGLTTPFEEETFKKVSATMRK